MFLHFGFAFSKQKRPWIRMDLSFIIEDDFDDQDILAEVFKELNLTNEIIFFSDGIKALHYLTETDVKPFIFFQTLTCLR